MTVTKVDKLNNLYLLEWIDNGDTHRMALNQDAITTLIWLENQHDNKLAEYVRKFVNPDCDSLEILGENRIFILDPQTVWYPYCPLLMEQYHSSTHVNSILREDDF